MPITLGPIIGHTTTDSVKIWLRGEEGSDGTKPIAAVDLFKDGQRVQSRYEPLGAQLDYCGVVAFGNLKAGTEYEVRADCLHFPADQAPAVGIEAPQAVATSPATRTGNVRTAVADARKIRFIFGSCRWQETTPPMAFSMREGDIPFETMARLHRDNPYDFLMLIGDQVYTDAMAPLKTRETAESIFDLYRATYKMRRFRKFTGKVPTYMILDDHEIEDDWSRNRLESGGDKERKRFEITMRAYQAYQNLRNPDTDVPGEPDARLWYTFQRGVFPFFVLDNMTQKWTKAVGNRKQTILGETQWNALTAWLSTHRDAPVKFIVTPEPVFLDRKDKKVPDKWPNFEEERARLLHYIRKEGIKNVVLLGGAVHNTSLSRMTCNQDPEFEMHSLVSSPIYAIPCNPSKKKNMCLEDDLNLPDPDTGTSCTFHYKCKDEDFFIKNSFMEVEVDADREKKIHAVAYRRKGEIEREYKF